MNNRNLHHLPAVLTAALIFCLFLPGNSLSGQQLEGMASFYADRFEGKKTSTGETFRQAGYSAASNELPWGTIVEVTNLSNGKTTQVRVNDCGPHSKGRLIDISKAAASDLDFVKAGEAKVRLRIIQTSDSGPTCSRGAWAKRLKAQGKPVPPPPAAWDPTKTVVKAPVNPVVPGPVLTNSEDPIPEGELRGKASYYADRFQGRPTSTGEIYDRRKFTAASKDFPYGTRLEVMNIVNGKKVEVKVNDCGPNSEDRILDLSRAAAERIDIVQAGVAMVQVRILNLGTQGPTCNRGAWAKAQRDATAESVPLSPGPGTYGSTVQPPQAAANLVDAHRVQVGAFGSSANAANLIAALKEKGYEEVYGEADQGLTKVYVGMLSSETAAKTLETDLRKSGYDKASVKSTKVTAAELRDPVTTYSAPQAAPALPEFDPTDILFGVQIGAYSSRANADKAIAGLRENGFVDVYSAKVGKMYRVFSGKYYFQNQAADQKAKLREAGYDGATVRRVQ